MNEQLETIKNAISRVVVPLGFIADKRTWRRKLPEVLQVIHLDKSPYGNFITYDYGIHLRTISNELKPPIHKLHVRFAGVGMVDRIQQKRWAAAMNLDDSSISLDERVEMFISGLRSRLLPVFEYCVTQKNVKEALTNPDAKRRFLPIYILLDVNSL